MQSGQPRSIAAATPRLRLRVTAAGEQALRRGHPWVFASSVREMNRPGETGELAVIYDRNDRFLAAGLFDSASPIRVRVLHHGKPILIDEAWWQARLEHALSRRRGMFDDLTTGYRLINGESDGWPGLVLDRYDRTLVIKIYTAAWLPRIVEVAAWIRARQPCDQVILRWSRNIRDSVQRLARTSGNEAWKAAGGDAKIVSGDAPQGTVVFQESGLRFEADVLKGQKTGFFLDQRENRKIVESLSRGRSVLNAFSFSGGFSLYAARGGSKSVTDLDISAHALESAKRNFALNRNVPEVAGCRHECSQADAFEWLGRVRKGRFGLIVLDPPSFAKREADRAEAIRAYGRLVSLAMNHLEPRGILVACSCSAHVSATEFFQAVRRSAIAAGARVEELRTTGHAADHPAAFQEAEYLKAIYLRKLAE